MGQAICTTQFFLYGRRQFTRTGWVKAKAKYQEPQLLDTVDLNGKVFLVTGGNSGIGRELVEYLAGRGARVYVVCRNAARGETALSEIRAKHNGCDLRLLIGDCGLQDDVRRFSNELQGKEKVLHGLVCNAGALTHTRMLSQEGVETTFATHLLFGSYLLTGLMLPLLQAASTQGQDPRVIYVSSGGMLNTKFPKWEIASASSASTKYDGQLAYAYAKRGQVLLAERLANSTLGQSISFVSAHPGWCDTPGVDSAYGSQKRFLEPMRTLWEGTEGIAWLCATDAKNIVPGSFYLDRNPQAKHIAGPCFTEGSFTKNTPQEVDDMLRRMQAACRGELFPNLLTEPGHLGA